MTAPADNIQIRSITKKKKTNSISWFHGFDLMEIPKTVIMKDTTEMKKLQKGKDLLII
jgi:hypothetical protein